MPVSQICAHSMHNVARVVMVCVTIGWSCTQDLQRHAQGFAKKSNTLASALHQQGRAPAALQRLGSAIALLAQLQMPSTSVLQWLIQSFVNVRAVSQAAQPEASHEKPSRGNKASGRISRQKSMLASMQKDAAAEIPINAPVSAYIQRMQPETEAEMLGKVVAMELKALHQVGNIDLWLFSTSSVK